MHPLLPLPAPNSFTPKKSKNPFGAIKTRLPTIEQQIQRFDSKLDRLYTSLKNHNTSIHNTIDGQIPEKVLVIETKSDPASIQGAINRIPGLEWMVDYFDDKDTTNEYFFEEKNGKDIPMSKSY